MMRHTIFIDIETLPALNLPASGSPPVKTASSEENHLKTALNGDFGRLLCRGEGFFYYLPRAAARILTPKSDLIYFSLFELVYV